MPNFSFATLLLQDNVVTNYSTHAKKIYNNILHTDNIKSKLYFGQLGHFLMLVTTNDGVKLIYNLIPGKANIFTNKRMNYKAVNRFIRKGAAVEVKDLTKEQVSSGKVANLEKLLDAIENLSITTICPLRCNNMSFRSFTFCPSKILELLINSNK